MKCPITGNTERLIKLHSNGNVEAFHESVTLKQIYEWEDGR